MSSHTWAALLYILSALASIGGVWMAAADIAAFLRRQQAYRRRIGELSAPTAQIGGMLGDVKGLVELDVTDPGALSELLASIRSRLSALEERADREEEARRRATDEIVNRIQGLDERTEAQFAAGTKTTEELIALATNVDQKPRAAVYGVVFLAIGIVLGLVASLLAL